MNGFHPSLQPRRGGSGTSLQSQTTTNVQHNSNGTSNNHPRVRFPEEEEQDEGEAVARVFSSLCGIFFGAIASICLLGVLTILGILYVVVRPFSVSTYRRVANQLAASSFLDAIALLLPNLRLYLTGDSDVPSPVGTSILVCNHAMDGDWWAILMLGRCVGLRGSVKAMMRNEILNLNVQNSNCNSDTQQQQLLFSSSASAREAQRERRSVSGIQLTPSLLKQATAAIGAVSTANGGRSVNGNGNGYGTPGPDHSTNGGHHHQNNNNNHPSPTSSHTSNGITTRHQTSRDLRILAKLLHAFMEFPLLNGEDYISDREHLFQLLRSFAENNGAEAPVHLLFFPEGWSLHNGADRKNVLAMSNEFAKREGRPQLKHLLLPKTTGFNASLECLRESSPVVYDVTLVSESILVFSNYLLLLLHFVLTLFGEKR